MSITSADIAYDPPTNEGEDEMALLLKLINAEWTSDPSSVACFDLRIVREVQAAIVKYDGRKAREKKMMRRFGFQR